ncbi:MAG: UDP-N-acetylglucosamine 2-epimerase (non-hydrolyzing) [Candidatus Margulisiibacteriota bacterium]
MKKIAVVIGTRPEGIKLSPLINCIKTQCNDQFTPLVISTGQHKEILDDVFHFFNIKPDVTLEIDRSNTTLSSLQSQLVQALEAVFIEESPSIVVVQGDTHSTLSGAIAAFYQKIPIAYVESGLRSGNLYEPFPEEANRRMITQLTQWHFTPTPKATNALRREGITDHVYEVGNTVIDALFDVQNQGLKNQKQAHPWTHYYSNKRKMMLITVHRRENWGNGLNQIILAVQNLVKVHSQLDVVWLTHPNPSIKEQVNASLGNHDQVYIYPPANYVELVQLMSLSTIILTDSGGIQEEAPSLNKPVLVARDVTERMEGVIAGCAKLVGTNTQTIIEEVTQLLSSNEYYASMTGIQNPYGDGTTSHQILDILSR